MQFCVQRSYSEIAIHYECIQYIITAYRDIQDKRLVDAWPYIFLSQCLQNPRNTS